MNILILLLAIAVLLIGIVLIIVQVFLSKAESKWLGLILPVASFIFSVVLTLTTPYWVRFSVWILIPTFFLANIPTGIFGAIYLFCRKPKQSKNEISKMNIQDLE